MKFDIVRAWKDQSYRASLSKEQLGQLPANPAGEVELSDAELESVYGGHDCHFSGCHRNGWGDNGNFDTQQNSNICSVICSHNCKINILDILNLGLL
jgi:mersacidin/lichenicidin family type 2 lantibiotic